MVVVRGNETTIGQSMYGWDNSNTGYFEDNLRKIKDVIKDTASSTYKNIMNVYNTHNDIDLIKRAKRLLSRAGGGVSDDNVIVRYNNPRMANRRMRSYIMADRKIRDLCNRGILDGYSDIDVIKDPVMLDTLDCMSKDGIYQDDGSCYTYHSLNGVDMEEDAISFAEQMEIAFTRSNAEDMLNKDLDPTSRI